MRARVLRSRKGGWSHVWLHLSLLGHYVTISRWGVSCVWARDTDEPVYLVVAICAAVAVGAFFL